MRRSISELDVFFLSFDEPNAEKHWALLLDLCPWAKRVHGVRGFDAAHRACAEQSVSDWFITVDADNIVRPSFFDQIVDLKEGKSFSWNGENVVNGLIYGNGGLKLWSRSFALSMRSHENAVESTKQIDFCWDGDYQHIGGSYSTVHVNGSPYQAFRVGFREGVKLSLPFGDRIPPSYTRERVNPFNLRNLRIWCSVGADKLNGRWAILGARMGWRYLCDASWDYTVVRDYAWFDDLWREVEASFGGSQTTLHLGTPPLDGSDPPHDALADAIETEGDRVRRETGIALPVFDVEASALVREAILLRNG